MQTLRPYQHAALSDAIAFVHSISGTTSLGAARRRLYSAPTGTGKGTIQLAVQRELNELGKNAWITTPSREIVTNFLERLGESVAGGAETIMKRAWKHKITTPVRLVNSIRRGKMAPPGVLIGDEGHHLITTNAASGDILATMMFNPCLAYTATPFRGSPRSTQQLHDDWGKPVEILTLVDAVRDGWMLPPQAIMRPLFDDDKLRVTGGDFNVADMRGVWAPLLPKLADLVAGYWGPGIGGGPGKYATRYETINLDKPTIVALPDTQTLCAFGDELRRRQIPWVKITQESTHQQRLSALEACELCNAVLLVIRCVSEGFDAPWLGRIIDARPTVSPVLWMQLVGRACRPGVESEYVCTNRNLERHAYLFAGAWPPAVAIDASSAFEEASSRAGLRQIGLEPLARFKRISVPLLGGGRMAMYLLYSMDGMLKTEWCVMIVPGQATPLVARRVSAERYGKWKRASFPSDFEGYQTSKRTDPMSDKMENWWRRSAGYKGLDPDADINFRQFAALPVLHNLGLRVTV